MSGRGKRGVTYIQNEEPAFIKQFKERTGYKEEATIDSKRETLQLEDEDRSDNEDEQPTIVTLKNGDLTADEVKLLKNKVNQDQDDELPEDGKIKFRKPEKRQSSEKSDLLVSSKKAKEETKKDLYKTKDKKPSKNKGAESKSLLSFGDDEDDDDDT